MSTGPARSEFATPKNARSALVPLLTVALLSIALTAGCGGGGDETEEAPRKALVPAAMDDTSYAPVDTTAWRQMGGTGEGGTGLATEADAALTTSTATDRPVPPAESAAGSTARPASSAAPGPAGPFLVQAGSFRNLDNARQQADRIRALGHDPVLEASVLGGQTYHRVVLRGLPDHAAASALGERIHAELGITYLVRRTD